MVGKRVLLVDDEVAVRNLYQLSLEKEGMVVVTASGRSEATHQLSRSQFDAAVVDLHLLDGDGLEFLLELREREPNMDLMAMSGYVFSPELSEKLERFAVKIYPKYEPLSRLVALLKGK